MRSVPSQTVENPFHGHLTVSTVVFVIPFNVLSKLENDAL